jgi:hypothetical protein
MSSGCAPIASTDSGSAVGVRSGNDNIARYP